MILKGQKKAILDLFKKQKEVSNVELNAICFRYGARIKELRDFFGFDIQIIRRGKHGLVVYALFTKKGVQQTLFSKADLRPASEYRGGNH